MQKTIRNYYIVVLFAVFLIFYLMVYFPTTTNVFDYWHEISLIKIIKNGYIDQYISLSGYYILTVVLSMVANIDLDLINILPLQFVPLLLIILSITKFIFKEKFNKSDFDLIFIILFIAYFIRFGNQGSVLWWSHGVGFILFLNMTLVILKKSNSSRISNELSITYIIMMLGLNYISYKLMFFAFIFIFFYQLIEYAKSVLFKQKPANIKKLVLISLIVFLYFNTKFYEGIGKLSDQSDLLIGFNRYIFSINPVAYDIFTPYYFKYPSTVLYANIFYIIFIFLILATIILYLLNKVYVMRNIQIYDVFILALISSSLINFLLYTGLGNSDFTFIIFSVIFGSSVILSGLVSKFYKFTLYILIFIIIVNFYTTLLFFNLNYYSGMKGENDYKYIHVLAKKMDLSFFSDDDFKYTNVASDIFTSGYMAKEFEKSNVTKVKVKAFSLKDMLLLFNLDKKKAYLKNTYFIINNRLNHFQANDWNVFASWKYHAYILDSNVELKKIYNTGYMHIYN